MYPSRRWDHTQKGPLSYLHLGLLVLASILWLVECSVKGSRLVVRGQARSLKPTLLCKLAIGMNRLRARSHFFLWNTLFQRHQPKDFDAAAWHKVQFSKERVKSLSSYFSLYPRAKAIYFHQTCPILNSDQVLDLLKHTDADSAAQLLNIACINNWKPDHISLIRKFNLKKLKSLKINSLKPQLFVHIDPYVLVELIFQALKNPLHDFEKHSHWCEFVANKHFRPVIWTKSPTLWTALTPQCINFSQDAKVKTRMIELIKGKLVTNVDRNSDLLLIYQRIWRLDQLKRMTGWLNFDKNVQTTISQSLKWMHEMLPAITCTNGHWVGRMNGIFEKTTKVQEQTVLSLVELESIFLDYGNLLKDWKWIMLANVYSRADKDGKEYIHDKVGSAFNQESSAISGSSLFQLRPILDLSIHTANMKLLAIITKSIQHQYISNYLQRSFLDYGLDAFGDGSFKAYLCIKRLLLDLNLPFDSFRINVQRHFENTGKHYLAELVRID